jgi:replicative DNA helicase
VFVEATPHAPSPLISRAKDPDIEDFLVAQMLQSPARLKTLVPLLRPEMFRDPDYYGVLSLAASMCRQSAEISLVAIKHRLLEAGRNGQIVDWLSTLLADPRAGSFEAAWPVWLDTARTRYVQRKETKLGQSSLDSQKLIESKRRILEEAARLGVVDCGLSSSQAGGQLLSYIDAMREPKGVLSLGFHSLEGLAVALIPGTLTVIAARPGSAKTSLACQIANHNMLTGRTAGRPVLINSLEMAPHALHARLISIASQVPADFFVKPWMYSKDQVDAALDVATLVERLLHHRIGRWPTAHELETAIEASKPSLVVIDYIQLIRTPSDYRGSRADFLAEYTNAIADLARRYLVPILALAQEKRKNEADGSSRSSDPLSGIKGSGGIEEAADTVFMLSTDPNSPDEIKVSLAKARFGGQMHREITLYLKGETTTLCVQRKRAEIGVIPEAISDPTTTSPS